MSIFNDPSTSGGFKLEETGETDVRGAYCAASVAHLTQIMTKVRSHDALKKVMNLR